MLQSENEVTRIHKVWERQLVNTNQLTFQEPSQQVLNELKQK